VSGRIVQVARDFYAGGGFTAGELLFQIDPRDYELDVQGLSAEVARAHTSLDLETAESNAAASEWGQLNGQQPVPDLVARRPQLAEAHANLQAARASHANAQLALSRTRYELPFAGRVLTSRIGPGQFVQAGQSYGTAFDSSTLDVVASWEGQQLEWLLRSPQVRVIIDAEHLGQLLSFEGELRRSASSLNPTTRFATVRFGFKTPPAELLPGVFTRVTVHGPAVANIAQIPASAWQQGGIVWFVNADQQLQAFRPEILHAGSDYVAVSNVPGPVRIVTNRLSGASEGTNVITASDETNAAVVSTLNPAN
jgi:RND family efflux transporter MFP subunit